MAPNRAENVDEAEDVTDVKVDEFETVVSRLAHVAARTGHENEERANVIVLVADVLTGENIRRH